MEVEKSFLLSGSVPPSGPRVDVPRASMELLWKVILQLWVLAEACSFVRVKKRPLICVVEGGQGRVLNSLLLTVLPKSEGQFF